MNRVALPILAFVVLSTGGRWQVTSRFAPTEDVRLMMAARSVVGTKQPAVVRQADPSEPQATDANGRLNEIMQGSGGVFEPSSVVHNLEQFIRDNPRFELAETYLMMLMSLDSSNPDRTVALADQVLAKYSSPHSMARAGAMTAKLSALRAQQKGDAVKELELKQLEAESKRSFESIARYESLWAGIYQKMGNPDLELESDLRSFVARIDATKYETVRALAVKLGKDPEAAFARARELRKAHARTVSGFELKTLNGTTSSLDSFKSAVTLMTFFYPT
jgi:hypothetical protein